MVEETPPSDRTQSPRRTCLVICNHATYKADGSVAIA
jgi:hypothetical protein